MNITYIEIVLALSSWVPVEKRQLVWISIDFELKEYFENEFFAEFPRAFYLERHCDL